MVVFIIYQSTEQGLVTMYSTRSESKAYEKFIENDLNTVWAHWLDTDPPKNKMYMIPEHFRRDWNV